MIKSMLVVEISKMLHNEIGYTFLTNFDGHVKTLSKYTNKDLELLFLKLKSFQAQKELFKQIVVGNSNNYSEYGVHQLQYNQIFEKVILNLKDSTKTLELVSKAHSKSTKVINETIKKHKVDICENFVSQYLPGKRLAA